MNFVVPHRARDRAVPQPCAVCAATAKRSACSHCESVWYCDSACQRKDWPTHRKICKARGAEKFRRDLELAEAGNLERQNNIGCCYFQGLRVARDLSKAVYWWKRAADAGAPEAQHSLALCFMNGEGTAVDLVEAVRLLQLAATAGNASAQTTLGVAYMKGLGGLKEDAATAVHWFRKASEQGYANALLHLGCALYYGDGIPVDEKEGLRLLQVAAESGLPAAQFSLGLVLSGGELAPWDGRKETMLDMFEKSSQAIAARTEGMRWIKRAASMGHKEAQLYMAQPGMAHAADEILAAHEAAVEFAKKLG